MSEAEEIWPDEGELLVCTVKGVKENGAYLNLGGYGDKEGFVFIGEVASGWVKNIRAHLREGQRVVAKVVTIKKDRERVDLSIKAVSAERRKDTLQKWKNQQRASQIMRVAAQRVDWDEEKTEAISEEMIEKFGSLYGALEECAISETALSDSGFTGKWMKVVTELAVENIVPPFVEIRGIFDIEVWGSEGVGAIRDALSAAERTVEDELEEQLTEEEIENFQIEKVDMERLTNKICDILAEKESDGMLQSELWKKLKLSSRDGSRLSLKLERMGTINREKLLENDRWTYKLILKKTPISTQSIENSPCLVCTVEQKCSLDGEISPKTCQLIEDWVIAEYKKPSKAKK